MKEEPIAHVDVCVSCVRAFAGIASRAVVETRRSCSFCVVQGARSSCPYWRYLAIRQEGETSRSMVIIIYN